ncbi:MAG: NUDIX domain-containing protein [Candidatus Woesearchaeota archaeon]
MTQYASFKEYLRRKVDSNDGPFMATDIIIRYTDINGSGKEGIVLIERKFLPYGLALPGGIAERMQFHKNAIKEAKEETGLDIVIDDIYRPLCVLSNPIQDPRAFISTCVYTAQGYGILKPKEDEDAKWAEVFTLNEISRLLPQSEKWAFPIHHRQALEIYLRSVNYGRK